MQGALAQSLYFQFADHAVAPTDEMTKLYMKGLADARYMRIWQDIAIEQIHLRGWFKSIEDETKPSTLSLVSLQRALHFRTVSDPADEPLCIATLLSLDQKYVVGASTLQDRMVRVWELIAKKLGGTVPARILFSSDETLDVPGWRWAPRSLLGASDATKDSVMDVHHRIMRFRAWRSDEFEAEDTMRASGVPTPWGLRVQMGGYILKSIPLLQHLPLHPWERVAGSHEDMILVKHSASGRWLRLMDFYRLEMSKKWSPEERREYDRRTDNLLCRLIDSGGQALLYDRSPQKGQYYPSLMVRFEDGWNQQADVGARQTLRARRERMVIFDWASPAHTIVAEGLEELALKVAKSDVTERFLKAMDSVSDWEQGRRAMDQVKDYMKAVVAEKWAYDPAFVEAVRDTRGPKMEDLLWAEIQMRFSHSIVCEEVPDSQAWLVD
ncbi:hypothetical protein Sste5346_006169 [Sporothrix stenoceras]|uniref:Uncharacterized protein n=1 Tax=Sporothrix stenoceras TaxID=5173 RepID=A0ABR3Z1F1_9PEZI